MSYLHGLYLDSFQTTKKHSYDSYSIYIAIFSSFLRGVYPVGVTDLRPYFTRIIGNNSVNVHRIPTKRGTEIRYTEPFKCAKFQPDWSTHSCFMANFAKCAKRSRRKKRRKNKRNFGRSYLGNNLCDFLQSLYVDFPTERVLLQQIWLQLGKGSRSYKGVYFLPVNMLTVWHTGFLGRSTHYRVS